MEDQVEGQWGILGVVVVASFIDKQNRVENLLRITHGQRVYRLVFREINEEFLQAWNWLHGKVGKNLALSIAELDGAIIKFKDQDGNSMTMAFSTSLSAVHGDG